MMKAMAARLGGCLFALTLVQLAGCQTRDAPEQGPERQPAFASFSATERVCLNHAGIPIARVVYDVSLNDWSNPSTLCVDLFANGEAIHPTVHQQCMDDGTSGEYTFSLIEHFGSNIPSEFTIMGELVPAVAGETQDTASTTVVTDLNCPPPDNLPGG
jgi:hypothetical protein